MKGDWTYLRSETLGQQIAIDRKSGWLFCRDGVKYSPRELEHLKAAGEELPLEVHLLKKEFDGEIIFAEKKVYRGGGVQTNKNAR